MADILIRKLGHFGPLPGDDLRLLGAATARRIVDHAAGEEIVSEGERPQAVTLCLEGWACRSKSFADGRRQIVGLLLPGDLFDLDVRLLPAHDHAVVALTPVVVAELAAEDLQRIAEDHPQLARALRRDALIQAAIQREWIVNVGRRSAPERIAHLLCELFHRLAAVGLTDGRACELPLTQTEIADATALSVVHVNRVLQQLRSAGLLRLHGKQMELPDPAGLQRLAQFDPGYLAAGLRQPEPDGP